MDALQGMTNRTAGPAGPPQAPVRDDRPDPARLQKLRRAAQEFEALFVRTLLRAMRNTIPESGIINDQGEIKYYRQLFDEELADTAAGAGSGLGVAQMIVRQYARGASQDRPAGSPASPGAPEVSSAQAARRREALLRYRAAASLPEDAAGRSGGAP